MSFSSTIITSFPKLELVKPSKPFSPFLSKVKPNCSSHFCFSIPVPRSPTRLSRQNLTSPSPATMLHGNPVVSDVYATAISAGVALSLISLWQETARRGLFDQLSFHVGHFAKKALSSVYHVYNIVEDGPREKKLNRKLVHISIGLAFMLCWPLFSSGSLASLFAALIPGVNIIRMLLIGLGIQKDEATVKSMSRFGDYRELLKGPLYYATTITLASVMYWRTSPMSIAVICNLCAGDGMADIIGRRFGSKKIPYNRNKSLAGSIAMASAGFLVSIGYMYYFSSFGYIEDSWKMFLGFLIVSLATAVVESLPISSELDDNLTVPLTSILVGSIVF